MMGGTVHDTRAETEADVLEEALQRWIVASRLTTAGRTEASAVFWERLGDRPIPTSTRGIDELVGDRLTGMQVAYLADVLRDRPLTRRLRTMSDTARARRLLMRMTAGYALSDEELDGVGEPPAA